MRPVQTCVLCLLCASLLSACSGGSDPATPAPQSLPAADLALPISDVGLPLAVAHLAIDPATGTVDVSPLRLNTAIGDAYLVGLNSLRRYFAVTAVDREVTPDGVTLTLDTEFRHPFPAAARPDLMGWDLKAILATDRDATTIAGGTLIVPADLLANAAGFTGEWNPAIKSVLPTLTSTAFPYVILGEDRTAPVPFDLANPTGWNCFPAGSTATGQLVLNLDAAETLEVDLFFTVGYEVSATRATRQNPLYQPPRGNMRAPWRIDTALISNNLSTTPGTFANVSVNIWDWQHGLALGSDVTTVTVHAPALLAAPLTPAITGGTGRDTDPLTASVVITNELGTVTTSPAYALIEVTDALHLNNPGGQVGSPGQSVVEDDLITISDLQDFRTFQLLALDVNLGVQNLPPSACVTSDPPLSTGSLTVVTGTTVQWDASCSTDPDPPTSPEGTLTTWEWDFEWDGDPGTFTDDTGGAGTAQESHLYDVIQDTRLGLRVSDGRGLASAILDIPVFVVDRLLVLTLGNPANIVLPPWMVEDQREMGACFTQLADDRIELDYTAEELGVGLGGYVSYQMTSYYEPGTDTWSPSVTDLSSSGSNNILEAGFWLKNCANYGPSGQGIVLWGFTVREDHSGSETCYAHNVRLGTLGLVADIDAAIDLDYGHCFDLVGSPVDGSVFVFTAPFTRAQELQVRKGGPDLVGTPITDWRTTYTPTIIDPRPSNVSQTRSVACGDTGDLHIAYCAADQTQLRYARDPGGSGAAWTTLNIADGSTLGEPVLDLDGDAGVYLAVTDIADGTNTLFLYSSSDGGQTWDTGQIVKAGGGIRELSLNVREVLGNHLIAVGYSTSDLVDDSGETRVRWTINNGSSWTDQLISTASNTHWPATFINQDSPDFYAAWSADDLPNFVYMQAVHGVFEYE